jgi:hypothetical protein
MTEIPDPPLWVKQKGKAAIDMWNAYWSKELDMLDQERRSQEMMNNDPRDQRPV